MSFPQNLCLASLGKACDAKLWPSDRFFYLHLSSMNDSYNVLADNIFAWSVLWQMGVKVYEVHNIREDNNFVCNFQLIQCLGNLTKWHAHPRMTRISLHIYILDKSLGTLCVTKSIFMLTVKTLITLCWWVDWSESLLVLLCPEFYSSTGRGKTYFYRNILIYRHSVNLKNNISLNF